MGGRPVARALPVVLEDGAFGLFVALYGPLLAGSRGGAARSVGAADP